MDPAPQTYVDLVKVILDFIGQHLWSLIALVFLIICRKSIANLVERITKLNFSWGSASGGVEAAAPIPTPEASQRSETVSTASQPSSSAPELPELKEKEEAQEWFSEMHKAFIDGKIEKAKQVFEANQREEHDANRRHSNEAVFLFFLYTKGNDATALSRLEALHARSANDKQRNDSIFWLLWSYEVSKNHDKAERLLQSTISMVTDEAEKTSHIIDLANVYKSKGEPDRGIECLV